MKTKILTLLLLSIVINQSLFSQLNMTYQGNITYDEDLSDIWGYVAPDSTEYAIVGVYDGVSIVDLTDPTDPTELFFIEGVNSIWRDIKTWGEFAYVSNETSSGLMVIDLSQLPDTATAVNWTPSIDGLGTLSSIHNIWIDEFGYVYIAGSNLNSGGIVYVDVHTTPGDPQYAGHGPATYAHDVFVRDNLMYSSEIYAGQFAIYDVEDKDSTEYLGSQNTLFNFAHNAWLSDDGNILFTTDELANATVGAYDVSDPEDIQELDQFVPYETLGDGVIPHNVHVWNDWLIISYYTDGCILVDGSNPENLVEVGNFDTYIPASTGFSGAWGAYPYLPSGLVLVSDIGNGMYVLEPNYVRACWLEGNITRSDDNSALSGASIEIVTTNVLDQSDVFGDYATGYATSGLYDIVVSKPGFQSDTIFSFPLQNDSTSYLDVALDPLSSFAFSGTVLDAESGDPISVAKVYISNGTFTYDLETVANGSFSIEEFYSGTYEVFAGKWGYKTYVGSDEDFNENNGSITIELEEGYEDNFCVDLGWNVTNGAISGNWERAIPIGVQPPGTPIFISPEFDVDEDDGNFCYVTGNTSNVNDGVVLGGNTVLTSPTFDVSDYETPYLSFYSTFFNLFLNSQQPGPDELLITLSNGTDEVEIASYTYETLEEVTWMYFEIGIETLIEPSENMSLEIECESSSSFSTASEAAFDYFKVWDAGVVGINETTYSQVLLNASPNPSNDQFYVQYDLTETAINSYLDIYNSLGQKLESVELPSSKGQVFLGKNLDSGIYIVKLYNDGKTMNSIKLIKE